MADRLNRNQFLRGGSITMEKHSPRDEYALVSPNYLRTARPLFFAGGRDRLSRLSGKTRRYSESKNSDLVHPATATTAKTLTFVRVSAFATGPPAPSMASYLSFPAPGLLSPHAVTARRIALATWLAVSSSTK